MVTRSLLPLLFLALASCAEADAPTDGREAPAATGEGLVLLPAEESLVGPIAEGALERPYYHDFGEVRDGASVSHAFRLENRDPVPVTIQKITAACGCAVPSVRYVGADGVAVEGSPSGRGDVITLPAGVIAELEIRIDTATMTTKNAHKTLTTLVTTDSAARRYITLETHIFVQKLFDLVPSGVNFGRVPLNGEAVGSCTIVQAVGSDLELGEILSAPVGVELEVERADPLGRPSWKLTARITPEAGTQPGRWTGEVVLSTRDGAGTEDEPLVLGLQADLAPDIVTSPPSLILVARDAQSAAQVVVSTLLPGHSFGVRETRFVAQDHAALFDLVCEPTEPATSGRSSSWTLRLTSRTPEAVTEVLRGEVELMLDDPQHESLRVKYVAHPAQRP